MPRFGGRGRSQRTALSIVTCGIPRIDRVLNALCTAWEARRLSKSVFSLLLDALRPVRSALFGTLRTFLAKRAWRRLLSRHISTCGLVSILFDTAYTRIQVAEAFGSFEPSP